MRLHRDSAPFLTGAESITPPWTNLRNAFGPEPWEEKNRDLNNITAIVIHHSGVDKISTPLEIFEYHTATLQWPGIGYHFLVYPDGRSYYTGDIRTKRAHIYGRNATTIGICIVGNYTNLWPTPAAISATKSLIAWIHTIIPRTPVAGHYELALPQSPTACPGKSFPGWKPLLTL